MASSGQKPDSSLKRKQILDATANPAKIAHVGTRCTSKCFSCIHTENRCPVQSKLLDNCLSFLNSGVPCHFMFNFEGQWNDFPQFVSTILIDGFKTGHSFVEIEMEDRLVIIDFLTMSMVNLATKEHCPIGWINEDDKTCLPKFFTDGGGAGSIKKVSTSSGKKPVQPQSN